MPASPRTARGIIDAIHSGAFAKAKTRRNATFGFDVITACPDIPPEILIPRNAWADKSACDATAKRLAGLFLENFKQYEPGTSTEIRTAGPA